MNEKIIIYQVFTRLFGNDCRTCKPWGDKVTNGCGLMNDFTPRSLQQIRQLGATHIWYTGIIEHATQSDNSIYGIRSVGHPGVVKGMAGSVYAISDYYDVDPDLATSKLARMEEFENLVKRTHKAGLKAIIDFVPNHVARQYHSDVAPAGTEDLGAGDNQNLGFSPRNNFYYLPGQELHAHDFDLKGYHEYPAKATGNNNFSAWVGRGDWYETVKLNYGVDYIHNSGNHFDPIPDTWHKMLDILLFWAAKGIDGFRCDMAEMVPVEFWHYAIAKVKEQFPDIIFIAEVYNPDEYRNYIHTGGFDYLYDKVGLYDTLRNVICGYAGAAEITQCWQRIDDIRPHMLNFLENHDEQRLASEFFAGDAEKGRAALIVSACMGTNPMMIYFGQELGERGMDEEGFSGRDGRTTIFDYWTPSVAGATVASSTGASSRPMRCPCSSSTAASSTSATRRRPSARASSMTSPMSTSVQRSSILPLSMPSFAAVATSCCSSLPTSTTMTPTSVWSSPVMSSTSTRFQNWSVCRHRDSSRVTSSTSRSAPPSLPASLFPHTVAAS